MEEVLAAVWSKLPGVGHECKAAGSELAQRGPCPALQQRGSQVKRHKGIRKAISICSGCSHSLCLGLAAANRNAHHLQRSREPGR